MCKDQSKLTIKNKNDIKSAMESIKDGDLYRYLHRVGDDCIKSEIEWALKQMLDDKSFKTVVAVFKVATSE